MAKELEEIIKKCERVEEASLPSKRSHWVRMKQWVCFVSLVLVSNLSLAFMTQDDRLADRQRRRVQFLARISSIFFGAGVLSFALPLFSDSITVLCLGLGALGLGVQVWFNRRDQLL